MAEPKVFDQPIEQIEVQDIKLTGWSAPAGWYGFVPASGSGIIRRSGLQPNKECWLALERLGTADIESRSDRFDGRRMIRMNGGYIILNYIEYRERDYTTAARSKRYREKKRHGVTPLRHTVASRDVTQAEAEAYVQSGVQGTLTGIGTPSKRSTHIQPPSLEDVFLYSAKSGISRVDAEWFWNHMEGKGWKNDGRPVVSWQRTLTAWKLAGYLPSLRPTRNGQPSPAKQMTVAERAAERMARELGL